METERFEALIDAILAIIITITVLEIPLASNGSWEALFELKYEFVQECSMSSKPRCKY